MASFLRLTGTTLVVWSIGGIVGRALADGLITGGASWVLLSTCLMIWGAILTDVRRWLTGYIWPEEANVSREDHQRLQSRSDGYWELYKLTSDQMSKLYDRLATTEHRANRAERMVREAYAQGVRDGANAATREHGR